MSERKMTANEEGTNEAHSSAAELDEALNELGMLESVHQSRREYIREKWIRKPRLTRDKERDVSWCSVSSGSSMSSSSSSRKSSSSSTSSFSSSFHSFSRSFANSMSSESSQRQAILRSRYQSCVSSSLCSSFDLTKESNAKSSSSSFKSLDYPKSFRRHHQHHHHSQFYKPYDKPRRFSLQLGPHRNDTLTKDLCLSFSRGISLSDSEGSSGTGSGTGTPPPSHVESRMYAGKYENRFPLIIDKENIVETTSNPDSPIRSEMCQDDTNTSIAHHQHADHRYNASPLLLSEAQQSFGEKQATITLFRSKSLDDLNFLLETSIQQEHRLQSHQHLQTISPQASSSASCDIQSVINKIGSLEM